MEKNEKRNIISLIIVLFIILVSFYFMNLFTPLCCDDYSYSFNFSQNHELIKNPIDIIPSQIAHYNGMNGRTITHSLAQLFLLVGKNAFNIINSLFFVLLIMVIYYIAVGTFIEFKSEYLLLIYLMLLVITPAFGQSYLWIVGASNYLYGPLICLLYLSIYRAFDNKNIKTYKLVWKCILISILAFIAGWTNENMSVTILFVSIIYIVYYLVKYKKIFIWTIFGVIFNIFGGLLLLFSPGENKRLNADSSVGFGNIKIWILRAYNYTIMAIKYFWLLIILLILLLIVSVIIRNKTKKIKLKDMFIPFVYFCATLCSIYVMVIPPYFPNRAWSGTSILFIISVISLLNIVIKCRNRKVTHILITIVTSVLLILIYIPAINSIATVKQQYDNRMSIILNAEKSDDKIVYLPTIMSTSKFSCFDESGDLSNVEDEWPNNRIAEYYNIDKVIKRNE